MKAALILLLCVFQSAVAQSDAIRSLRRTVEVPSGRITTVYAENGHFEAPNCAADKVNNDHGISPDGPLLVLSHEAGQDWLSSSIYILPIDGAAVPRRVAFVAYVVPWQFPAAFPTLDAAKTP
ncbi:MAG: hypothetical protein AUI89_01175 [Gemmatimonadetes bacterium 13_1_40CM_3_65_8]|nr:MAG: hypothetical protein AUI89_01175 [Gemmatimonadetes bacterium 13_1_40CM_3_65_8]